MIAWPSSLEAMPIAVLAQVTVILSAAIALHQFVARSAAARHAVLLWALTAAALCPLFNIVVRGLRIAPLRAVTDTTPVGTPSHVEKLVSLLESASSEPSSADSSLTAALGTIWGIGSFVALARIGRGLHVARQIRRAALPVERAALEPLTHRLTAHLGRSPPKIFLSDQIEVPMALGCFRPVVLLPSALAAKLDDRQLLQVLLHECAHAIRRDPFVGLYERLFAAAFWFHPLVHICNRWLDRAREVLCDNSVLRAVAPTEYSRTLVSVAESISHVSIGLPAQALFQSRHHLDHRVAGLLNPRRCTMIRLRPWRIAAVAAAFVAGGSVLACFAAPNSNRSSGYDLAHIVNFETGRTEFRDGDKITIDEVHGTSGTMTAGNIYIIKGSYRLASEKSASLAAFVTGSGSDPQIQQMQSIPTQRTQTVTVDQGDGRFTLILYLWYDGDPHVSFYPADGGNSFGGVYFGTGGSTFK
jgi:beta-lactamase regulating signal transducer with metallopeptidase domain